MKFLFLLVIVAASAAAAPASKLPKEVETFLGKAPRNYDKKFLKPAKHLRAALDNVSKKKLPLAIQKLVPLAQNGELAEHATYELALAYRQRKEFAKSTAQAQRLIYEFPGTVYSDRMEDLIRDNDCDAGLLAAGKAKSPNAKAAPELERCLNRTSWKDWPKREVQANALYQILRKQKDALLGPFVSELIVAFPASSAMRVRLANDFSPEELDQYAKLARYRSKNSSPAGVKPIYPDSDLFDLGMQAAQKANWIDANAAFKKLIADFPQSERVDSAEYWIARSEEKLGNADVARKQYEKILEDSPLSYYGLQSALHLKRDLASLLSKAADSTPEKPSLEGALILRQARALWRLRALLEAGLIDVAREEAKFLFHLRPGGSTFGQSEPEASLMVARLYDAAGYSLAAFAHAYSAISFNPGLLETNTLTLIFPKPFADDFSLAGEENGLNPLLLFSVAKQESAFIPNALSRSDALGLLQLLPSTAEEMKNDLERSDLFDTQINTQLGAQYLRKLLDRFQGNIALALAAYNAGPSRAQQWQKSMTDAGATKDTLEVDIFIDSIPFSETRKYVGSILRNFAWYKLLNNDGTISSVQELAFQWQKTNPADKPIPETKDPAP
jgi:soluble lytic murein transglycosylase-like protein